MFVRLSLLSTLLTVLLAGCGSSEAPPAVVSATPENASPLPGKAEYERACAGCHETGKDGAPVTGDRDTWAGRSPLWEAVLYEHATKGYFDMPPMGGAAELTEREVEIAAEYMLSITYPEQPGDPH